MLGNKVDKGVVNRLVDKQVDQSVGPGGDGTAGELASQDMYDSQLLSGLGGTDDGRERWLVDCLPWQADLRAIVVNDFDVVRSLRDPCRNEGVGLIGRRDRREGKSILGAVATWWRNERAR